MICLIILGISSCSFNFNKDESDIVSNDFIEDNNKCDYWTCAYLEQENSSLSEQDNTLTNEKNKVQVDWDNIEIIQELDGIYIYKFKNQSTGKNIWIAWNDNSTKKIISLEVWDLDWVVKTEWVAKYETWKEVFEYEMAFNNYVVDVNNGVVEIELGEVPIFIEEIQTNNKLSQTIILDEVDNEDKQNNINVNYQETDETMNIPYYFLAIHNEPLPDINYPEMTLEKSYNTLKDIINKADEYNIKLTLMFTPKRVDYIISDSKRINELEKWKEQWHEIASHHHSVTHALWGGYTNFSETDALKIRKNKSKNESYIGTMNNYIEKIKIINPDIKSWCINTDPLILPDEIIYTTASNLANYGLTGRVMKDINPSKGINAYITVTEVNWIKRKHLTHAQITNEKLRLEAEKIFSKMKSTEVYWGVAHSIDKNVATWNLHEAESFMKFLDFIHSQDPTGEKSRTLSEVIEENLLPEKEIILLGN